MKINHKSIKLVATGSNDVWVAWTNTDRTEGRGARYALAVCETEATARRRGKGGDVQGIDCMVTKETAYFINSNWHYPLGAIVEPPTEEDKEVERALEAARVKAEKRLAALAKAKAAGLSDEDLANLAG